MYSSILWLLNDNSSPIGGTTLLELPCLVEMAPTVLVMKVLPLVGMISADSPSRAH